jgi:hypothetical protein
MKKYVALLLVVLLLVVWTGTVLAAGDGGVGPKAIQSSKPTASVVLSVTSQRTWNWNITKSVTPDKWDIFQGDEAVSTYTVTVTKMGSTDVNKVSGIVNITNIGEVVAGALPTKDLAITVTLLAGNGSDFVEIGTVAVNTSAMPVIAVNGSYAYPYSFDIVPVDGTTYMATAIVSDTNDMYHKEDPNTASSPTCTLITTETNATVHVTDTWAGAGSPWTFSDTGSVSYDRTFGACESGVINNTATITETGKSASAKVTINRYSLNVAKTACGTYSRKYAWTIDKTGDQTCLKINLNQSVPVNYTVTVTATPADSCFKAGGTITVNNPAPVDAVINSVSDIAGGIAGVITTPISYPYILKHGETLTLSYTMTLPDASARTNTATAVQQNYRYTHSYSNKTLLGTKSLQAQANIVFGQPTVTDGSAVVTDNMYGTLGTVQATASPAVFHYTLKLCLTSASGGGYTVTVSKNLAASPVPKCTDTTWKVTNTATLTTCTTHTVLSDCWTVTITKGTVVYTYTIGYWKTHSCEITKLLPISLGTQGGCKSIQIKTSADAVKYLGMTVGSPSNGIVKLYAQLLAAKLNIKNGADSSAVSSVVSSADAFLAKYNIDSWSGLSTANKNLVLSWATTLDNYNNGVIGPGHAN